MLVWNSLQGRILLLASSMLLLFALLVSVVLKKAFYYSLEQAAEDRLRAQLYSLLATAEERDISLQFPEYLRDDHFNQINSGLYGIALDSRGEVLWRSRSLIDKKIPPLEAISPGKSQFSHGLFLDGQPLLINAMGVAWEFVESKDERFTFYVMESKEGFLQQIARFESVLYRGLWGGVILLIMLQFIILKWGLSPIKKLADGISSIEAGSSERVEGSFPKELELVAKNLNLLVSNERLQRERYRNTLGDLAHSLKTPLAVIRNSLSENFQYSELVSQVEPQIERMDQIVQHQLQRSVLGSASVVTGCNLGQAVKKINAALSKVYYDRNIEQRFVISDDLIFYGDEGDLMEMMGNLLDNAHKHAHSVVLIKAGLSERNGVAGLLIQIEDDGDGMDEAVRSSVMQRGIRADTREPGQGIGLSMVDDICRSYSGEIHISGSELGGAMFTLFFKK